MARAWHLKSRPEGLPTAADFELKDIALPDLGDGMVRLRNRWLSVDPYMRGRMNDVKSYVAPFALGEPMEGGAIGEVLDSNADGLAPGDLVQHMAGWRDEAVLPARAVNKLPGLDVEPQLFLGVLGVPGATAWFGLLDVAQARSGETCSFRRLPAQSVPRSSRLPRPRAWHRSARLVARRSATTFARSAPTMS